MRVTVDDAMAVGGDVINDAGRIMVNGILPAFAGRLSQFRSFRVGKPGNEFVAAVDNRGQPVFQIFLALQQHDKSRGAQRDIEQI